MKSIIFVHRNVPQAEYIKTTILEVVKKNLNYGVVIRELSY